MEEIFKEIEQEISKQTKEDFKFEDYENLQTYEEDERQ